MQTPKDNLPTGRRTDSRPKLPFFIEFVKFFIAFVAIVATALLALRVVSAHM